MKLTKSLKMYEKAKRLIPGGTQTISKKPECYAPGKYPIFLEKGKGSHVWDVDGNEYIDYLMGFGPITLGYCYPATDSAARKQLCKGTIMSLLAPAEVEAADAISRSVPNAEMVRFFKTGAEATSAAVRVARAYTGREKVLSFGYHGWHDLWTALNFGKPNAKGVPVCEKDLIVPFEYNDCTSENSLDKILAKRGSEFACIMMEPVSYREHSDGSYLRWVRKLADKYNIVLIFDEIVTGFRLALGGTQELLGVKADLACFAKGMANGFPVSAVTGKRNIMKTIDGLQITSTYGGEALSLSAVVAAIKEYKSRKVHQYLWRAGKKLMDGLNEIARETKVNACWEGYAPMSSFRFGYDEELSGKLMTLFLQECAKRGVLLRRGGLLLVTFSHKEKDIAFTLNAAKEALKLLKKALDENKIDELLKNTGKTSEGIRKFK